MHMYNIYCTQIRTRAQEQDIVVLSFKAGNLIVHRDAGQSGL